MVKKFAILILVILLLGSCSNNPKTVKIHENNSLIGTPFIPENIVWGRLDSSNKYAPLYSNFNTFYFANDSLVFLFNGLNSKKLICIDTSILDAKDNVYNDTVFCHNEDSVVFGVENLQMWRGNFSINNNKITLKLSKQSGRKTIEIQDNPSEIVDTLGTDKPNHITSFYFENKKFVPTQKINKTSMNKLLQLTNSKF